MTAAQNALKDLPACPTMRDINDVCIRYDIPSLAQGMIELPPPLALRQILSEVTMEDGVHCYRNRFGEEDYRLAISKLNKEHYHADIPVDCILATQGVSGGIVSGLSLFRATNRPTKVAVLEPFYTYHSLQIQRTLPEAEVTYVKCKDNWELDFDEITKVLSSDGGVDIVVFTNPNNPSGRVYPKATVSKLISVCKQYDSAILVDECYRDLVWVDEPFYSPVNDSTEDKVLVCRGFSKVLGCQSWRVGYVISSPETIQKLMVVGDPLYICTPFSQHAFARYIDKGVQGFANHAKEVGDLMQDNWAKMSKALQERLGWEPLQPEGTMYGMFKHSDPEGDMSACVAALEAGVGVCPGSIFYGGNPKNTGFVRIHTGVSKDKADKVVAVLSASQ